MVATKHPFAAEAGVEMLRHGGSAVDAAVATSFALSVVEPYSSGIGGGGLALYQPRRGTPRAFHFGMRAPASATADMYEIVPGKRDDDLFGWPLTRGDEHVSGPRSIALPCQVPGLYHLWQIGGKLPWPSLLQPAIALARDGFPVQWLTSLAILSGYELLSRFPTSREIFLPHGRPPKPDLSTGAEILRQPNKARALEAIAGDPEALGKGEIADSIVEAADGRLTPQEIRSQRPLEGETISVGFGGVEAHLVPWATGGPTVLEWLGILRELDPPADERSPELWWAVVKAGEIAFRDRLQLLGDPDFVPFPSDILEQSYHRDMAECIKRGEMAPATALPRDGGTSHVSAVDADGNGITITQTLLSLFGSGVVTKDTGICLNNGMMWFDPVPGRPNSIEPGKQPLANMCPVLVTEGGRLALLYGASGGRKILPAVLQILVRVALLGQSLSEAMAAPRLDTSTDEVLADVRFGQAFCDDLSRRLHRPVLLREPAVGASPWASPTGLMRTQDGAWTGGADLYTMACVLEA
jgi:gamma-glutamyltranspeptidase/glutathione hydrolase